MTNATNEILSDITYRSKHSFNQRLYGPGKSYQNIIPADKVAHSGDREKVGLMGIAAYLVFLAACGSGPSAPGTTTTVPPTSNKVTLSVYNATTGQRRDMVVDTTNGSASVRAEDLGINLGDVVKNEFSVRGPGSGNLGSLIMAAGSQASIPSGSYDVFVPEVALTPNGQSIYDCMKTVNLKNGKRDLVVGVLNKPGVDPNGLPMYVWTDAIDELNKNIQSNNGTRYGSIKFDPNAANPDMTVGFANDLVADQNGKTGPAWSEGFTHCYMLGPKSVFPLMYGSPSNRDGAIEELFESLFAVDNICGSAGTLEIIGKAAITGNTQWGLTDAGVSLIRRNFTRSKP